MVPALEGAPAAERRIAGRTRSALIAAATAAFAEKGFEGARVDDIARRARVNKAMINYHFGGKAGLYRAILADTFEPAVARLQELRAARRPADQRLREFLDLFAEMVAGRPGLPSMLLREALSGGRHLDRNALPYFLSIFSVLREIVEQGIADRTFRGVNPFLTHLGLVGSLLFFFGTMPFRERLSREGHLPRRLPGGEEFLDHLKDLTTRALATGASARPARSRRRS